ncbi:electron transport complex subunit RsxC [Thalassotalea ponticola]|uniref:electron transport complex subunit RsxC n=1 Tax=Thalassotalea ponticola TaxID=1523392 RepID=UPI0025B5AD6B|nr:electron transport complex subunit RsxC [Thalassotalea ponticola]MDN3652192.1 electron transport complex subunit RsxC [Thalassotalea ponticola]
MESVIERIKQNKFFDFAGGIHPPEQKLISNTKPIKHIDLPEQLILPLKQHIGKPGDLLVKVGDKVLKGQALSKNGNPMAVPVHAPTSGTVTAIKPSTIAHPSAMKELCLFIQPDGQDQWRERQLIDDYKTLSKAALIDKISDAGIVGLGGAGFPTNIKVNVQPGIKFLIINAAECEPYITADDLLMREQAAVIASGIDILDHLLEPEYVLIGIEDNKPEAIKALQQATQHNEKIQVCVLPTKYPTGGEKQLIKALTNQEVATGVLPVNMGIVVQNVATAFAISEAVLRDTPLIQRVITVTGQAIEKPQNLWVPLGTPIAHLLSQVGFKPHHKQRIIMGGPLMGFALADLNVPAVKTTNCILAPSEVEIAATEQEIECVRCGQCADVCPQSLLPQELQWYAKAKDYDRLEQLNLFDCIDCGACAYVCPSHIPLVHYYRVAKATIRFNKQQEAKAERAKLRFEARKVRLEREKQEREQKHKQALEARRQAMSKEQSKASNSAVAAALARVKAKKAAQADNDTSQSTPAQPLDAKARAAAAIERAKAKKAAAQANKSDESAAEQPLDTKARAAAAIERAKAKKAAAQANKTDESAAEQPLDGKTKEARVAAAIERAKAKKAAAQANKTDEPAAEQPLDDKTKEARVAAAIERAKAKKAAAQANKTDESAAEQPLDGKTKEARVAAAIERAKAKKAASQSTQTDDNDDAVASADDTSSVGGDSTIDSKAAAKARAIAKAKQKAMARKATQITEPADDSGVRSEQEQGSAIDNKKAKIAAAVAKAKANKQRKNEQGE